MFFVRESNDRRRCKPDNRQCWVKLSGKRSKSGPYSELSVEELTLEQVGRLKGNQRSIALNRPVFIKRQTGENMKADFIILTNNPLIVEKLGQEYTVEYEDISYEDTLKKVRDYIYKGHELLTHPLSGSVKPNETPYKSVMVSEKVKGLNQEAVKIIEQAIHSCGKFEFKSDKYAEDVYDDFQYIDYTLISSALPSATAW